MGPDVGATDADGMMLTDGLVLGAADTDGAEVGETDMEGIMLIDGLALG